MGRKLSKVALALMIAVVAGVLAAAAVAGSSTRTSHAEAAAKYRIGLVLPDLSNLYIAGIRDGAQAQGKKSDASILVKGTNDAAGQTNAMLAYVGAKVDAIIVDAIDGNAIVPAVKAANKANIPVIAVQSNVNGGTTATFIAGREDHAGVAMGTDAVNWCKSIDPCKIGIVEGILADQSGAEENKAFRATVAKHANIKIVGAAETQYDPAKALNVATNLLTANPDLNYIYAWWDPGGAAAVKAIEAKGKLGKIGVASQNGDCIALGLVIKGSQSVTAAFFPSIIGGGGVTNAVAAIEGKKLPKYIEAPVLGVTTKLANDWLAGKSQPPAALKADIMKRLQEAKSGHCPTK
jgi:ABC-type sugar transport system substrate-binding protein